MKKLLVIVGPTATGKTSLALYLAKKYDAELISADSKQVYKRVDIGTGKDLPDNVKCQMLNVKYFGKRICFYKVGGIKLWGYDLVEPTEEFSVSQYLKIANVIIGDIYQRNNLPILVGGTGLYVKAVIDGIPTSYISKDDNLRKSLGNKKARELFEILAGLDPVRSASMNVSDKKNPRRLVRSIEIAKSKSKLVRHSTSEGGYKYKKKREKFDPLFVGLTTLKKELDKRIEKRVKERLKQGFEKEVESLIDQGMSWESQSMQALGYKNWRDYYLGKVDRKSAIIKWIKEEQKYAKRQMTWFKKDKRIQWFDVSKKNYRQEVEKVVGKWYIRE